MPGYFTHADAGKVILTYEVHAVKLSTVPGSGVRRIIPKGVMGEPIDHVEFHFHVCP